MSTETGTLLDFRYKKRNAFITLYYLFAEDKVKILLALLIFSVKHSPVWVMPIIKAKVINIVAEPGAHSLRELLMLGVLTAVVLGQNMPLHTLYMHFKSTCIRRMEARLRSALVRRLQQLSISFHDKNESGKLHAKLLRDVESIQVLSHMMIEISFTAMMSVGMALTVTMFNEPAMALFYVFMIPVCVLLLRAFRKRMRSRNRDFRQEIERMSSRMSDMIEMIPVTRAHGAEGEEIRTMDNQLEKVREKGYKLDLINGIFGSSSFVSFNLFLYGCLFLTAVMGYKGWGGIKVGDVVMYTDYFGIIVGSVNMLVASYPQMAKGFESIHSVAEVLECPDLERNQGKKPVKEVKGEFTFENVSFHYDGNERAALKDFNLAVREGECVAFVGESGAGKSTVVNLIIGFHRPTEGRILLDGKDMEELDLRQYRRFLAVVPQNTLLFSGTIRDNILYGMKRLPDEKIWEAVQMANAADFIEAFPEGLDTMIGEHGGRLSGGQRQRIAIARALIRDPRVIIFDEATSALDVASERLVQEAIERLIEHRTTFIVAHRLSTIRKANRVVVMKDGQCVEAGSQDELMAKEGEFHKLRSMQV